LEIEKSVMRQFCDIYCNKNKSAERTADSFSVADIQARCPGVSVDMIRKVLKKERNAGKLECTGLGRDARWRSKKPKNG